MAVTSASTTVVSCADVCRDSTIRWAITWRERDIRWLVPRSADGTIGGRPGAGRAALPPACAGAGGALAAAAAAGGGAAGRPGGRGGRRRRPGRLRLTPGAGGVEHVLLADTAPDAGAGQRFEVHAVLGGQLADQRRHVGPVAPGGQRGGRRVLAALVRCGGGRGGRRGLLRGGLCGRILRRRVLRRRRVLLLGDGRLGLRWLGLAGWGWAGWGAAGWAGGDQAGADGPAEPPE